MPRLPDHEIIASLQAQVSHLRIQLRNAESLIPADVKESLTTEIKETADAVIRDFEAQRARIEALEEQNLVLSKENNDLKAKFQDIHDAVFNAIRS